MQKFFIIMLILITSHFSFGQKINQVIKVKANEIKSIGIFPVISSIKILHSQKEKPLEQEEEKIERIVNEDTQVMLDEMMNKIELPNKLISLDSVNLKIYVSDFAKIINEVKTLNGEIVISYKPVMKRIVEKFTISDKIAELIKEKGERYALFTVNHGFTRTRISNLNRKVENTALNIASSLIPFPFRIAFLSALNTDNGRVQEGVTTYIVIVDAETKTIADFFIYTTATNPLNKEDMKFKQLYPTFSDFWVWYHPEAQQYLKLKRK